MRIKPPLRDTQLESPAGWCIRCRNELGSYDTSVIKFQADGKLPRVEYIGGRCDGPRCAWWDADKERCAVLSLARNK